MVFTASEKDVRSLIFSLPSLEAIVGLAGIIPKAIMNYNFGVKTPNKIAFRLRAYASRV
jgi:hypothetical protein